MWSSVFGGGPGLSSGASVTLAAPRRPGVPPEHLPTRRRETGRGVLAGTPSATAVVAWAAWTARTIREFLTSRRARISPEQAGLPVYGAGRRGRRAAPRGGRRCSPGSASSTTPASNAATTRGVSEDVLDGIARALQLDEAERAHLYDLVRAANAAPRPPRRRPTQERVRPTVQRILDAMTDAPAYVRNGRLDVLAANRLGPRPLRAASSPTRPAAEHRPVRLPEPARRPSSSPTGTASPTTPSPSCAPRPAATPTTSALTDLIGELSTRSEEFRRRWAAHDVKLHRSGVKRFHHPVVGDLTLAYEALELPGDPGQRINVYTAEPGSPSADALGLLASWAATPEAAAHGPRPPTPAEPGALAQLTPCSGNDAGPAQLGAHAPTKATGSRRSSCSSTSCSSSPSPRSRTSSRRSTP